MFSIIPTIWKLAIMRDYHNPTLCLDADRWWVSSILAVSRGVVLTSQRVGGCAGGSLGLMKLDILKLSCHCFS